MKRNVLVLHQIATPPGTSARMAIFNDSRSQTLLREIERIAPSDAVVLVQGATGTGKEVVARRVHALSKRAGPFVAVNCGALSHSLIEAELFGHQAGAFTGANETRCGWFEAANGGTLFLDEIGDLPVPMQVKLLRVLQEREVVRVGSRKPIAIDIRLIAATNVDLAKSVSAGTFRLDLYYRLNVVALRLASLRERREDILPLAEHFLQLHGERPGLRSLPLSPQARQKLLAYSWPGNIRELENVLYAALLIADGDVIGPEHLRFTTMPELPGMIQGDAQSSPMEIIGAQLSRLFTSPPPELYQGLEETIIRHAFAHCRKNQVHTAKLLGLSRNVLRTLLKRYDLISSESALDESDELGDSADTASF